MQFLNWPLGGGVVLRLFWHFWDFLTLDVLNYPTHWNLLVNTISQIILIFKINQIFSLESKIRTFLKILIGSHRLTCLFWIDMQVMWKSLH